MITSANIQVLFEWPNQTIIKIELFIFSPFSFHLFSLIIILLSTILKNAQNTVPMVLSIENYI